MKDRKRNRWTRLSAAVSALLLLAAFGSGPSPALAHGAGHEADKAERPELSFGRSEDYDYDPPAPGSYDLPPLMPAGDGAVLTSDGSPHRLHAIMDGYITVLAFIYTRCSDPQGCPQSLSLLYDLNYVAEEDPLIGDNVKLVAMSFDPGHDTPAVMAEFGYGSGEWAKDTRDILYLTTESQDQLAPILAAYDQAIGRKRNAGDPFGPLTHQLRVYLIDRDLRIRNIYSLGFLDPRLVISDIRTLLMTERAAAR